MADSLGVAGMRVSSALGAFIAVVLARPGGRLFPWFEAIVDSGWGFWR